MSHEASKSHHENNNGSFMDNTNNDTSQSGSRSFVGKVRSTLSKWFATPTRTSLQVVRPRSVMEADDSSNSDDDSEDYNQQQQQQATTSSTAVLPPSKRLKTCTTASETITSASVNNNNTARLSGLGVGSSFTLRNPKRLVLNRRNNMDLIQSNQDSDDSSESTSGYSSMPRLTQQQLNKQQEEPEEEPAEPVNASTSTSAQNPTSTNSTMINLHNRSLFDTSHDRSLFNLESSSYGSRCGGAGITVTTRPASLSARRPAFSGTNLTNSSNNNNNNNSSGLIDRTLATRRIYNSPFYSGRTLYGGASNLTIGQCFSHQSTVGKPTSKTTSDHSSSNSSTMLSSTARRILDTLESYTVDAQKQKLTPPTAATRRQLKQDHLFRSTSSKPYNRQPTNTNSTNKRLDELRVPNIAQLLKMKERLQNHTVQVRQMIKDSSSSATTSLSSVAPPSSGGKMRSKVTAPVRQHKQQQQQQQDTATTSAAVDEERLSAIQLPITALPTFTDLHLPMPPTATTITTNHKPTLTSTAPSTTSDTVSTVAPPPSLIFTPAAATITTIKPPSNNDKSKDDEFVFAKPLVLLDSGLNGSRLRNITAINNFKFSVPLNQKLVHRKQQQQQQQKVTTPDNVDSSSCTPQTAAKQRKEEQSFSTFKMPSSGTNQWECDVCLVRNPDTTLTCLACTSPKQPQQRTTLSSSTTTTAAPVVVTATSSVGWAGTSFKLPSTSNRWSCNTCLVSNGNERVACAACETPRTSVATAAVVAPSTSGNKDTSWECPSCMVRNQLSNQKCVCCETLQPGVSVAAVSTGSGNLALGSLVTKYNFGITPTTTTATVTTTSSSTSNSLVGFTFGIPSTTNSSSSSSIVSVATPHKPSAGFTFGIPPPPPAAATVATTPPTPTIAAAVRPHNGTVSSTTTLLNNQQQQQQKLQTLPNGMISSSNITAAAAAAAVVASTPATVPTTLPSGALAGIKFGPAIVTQPQPPPPFIFGRSAADVSSSTNRVTTTTTTATTASTSSVGSVSSTAAAQPPPPPPHFQFQPQPAKVPATFSKPPILTTASKPAVFNFGPSQATSTNSTRQQQQQQQVQNKAAPFIFGGGGGGGGNTLPVTVSTVVPVTPVAPTAGLFKFGDTSAATVNSAPPTPTTGFAFTQPSTMTMNFGGSNMFGQPKMKNGGFDFSVAKPAAPASAAVGFNFLPSAANAPATPPNNRGIFPFGSSSTTGGPNGQAPTAAIATAAAAAPFTFGAVSSSSQAHSDGSKQQTAPLSFGGITSSSSSAGAAVLPSMASPPLPHTNMFGSVATASEHSGVGVGVGVGAQPRIIRKAIRRTNTQPR